MDDTIEVNTLGKGLHFAHLNVRSLLGKGKADMVRHQIASSNIDVFTVSETWLNAAIPNQQISIPNYMSVRLDRSWGGREGGDPKRGGGLVSYIKQGIKFSDSKHKDLNVSRADLEMQWVQLEIPNVRPIVIVNVYRPPQGDYKKGCSLLLDAFNAADLKDNTDIFLLGDFNINLNDKKDIGTKELLFTTKALGLNQLVEEDTRFFFREGEGKCTRIDLIFSNSEFIKETKTLDYNISDHLAVMTTRKKVATKKEKVNFMGRSYRNYIKEDFQNRLVALDWGDFFEAQDVDLLWEMMERKIEEEIDRVCPKKECRVSKLREPWITNEAIEAIKDKDRLLRKAKRTGKEEDWEVARRMRNGVGRDLENLRADYLKQKQEEYSNDPKKFWATLGKIFPGKKQGQGDIWLKEEGKSSEVPPERIPEFVNTFFSNIGPLLAKEHKEPWVYQGSEVENELQDMVTNEEEVRKLCKEINPMKSSGIDKLSSRVCRDAFIVLVDKLVHIFNCSLRSNIFPKAWKAAKVIPLFKGGEREKVTNYRPVSLLALPGKLLEKIVHCRISSFLEDNNFLTGNQGGFRKGYSTVATIADLTDDLFEKTNEGLTTLAAFIDLSKAFDTVNQEILLKKLKLAGIRGNPLKWCTNYLKDRKQRAVVNGASSGYMPVRCGVPQGSVLGPLFFLVYVNDLDSVMGDCKVKLYADDTVLYQSGENCAIAEHKLQISMSNFARWCTSNALTINTKKTKLMAFGSRSKVKKCSKVRIKLNGERIKLVPSYKYLGVTLDPTLSYSQHIAGVIRTVHHKMQLLARLKKYLINDVALNIYKSMLLPYLDYADVIFCKANTSELDKLQKLQNRCLRICMGHQRDYSTNRVHREAKVPFLKERRRAHTLNFMFKRKSQYPNLLNNREIRTRAHDAPLFEVRVPRCEAFKRSVGYFGSEEWNVLPAATRNIATYLEFKGKQKKQMLNFLELQ